MSIDSDIVDDIVSGVLRQLGMASSDVRAASPDSGGSLRSSPATHRMGESNASASIHNTSGIELSETVITEDLLMEKAVGAAQIRISSDAVITPSGRDWLRKQDVAWERAETTTNSHNLTTGWRLIVAAPADAVDKLNEEVTRWGWAVDCVGGAEEAAVRGVTSLDEGTTGVVVLTCEPERVACRANRHRHVRAASVSAVADVTRVRQQLGANFVTLCPGERSFFELRNLMKTIAAGGPPEAPENW